MDEEKKSEADGTHPERLGPYLLEEQVQHTDWARAQDRQSAESLLFTLEGVLEEVRRMARAFDGTHEPSRQRRLGWGVVGAAMVGALLLALVRLAPASPPPSGPEPLANTLPRAQPAHPWGLVNTADAGQSVLASPLPKEPFKGQKRPPCHRYAEVELIGACWLPHKLKAPCPDVLYEHQGECYSPVVSAKPPPQSLGQ